MSMNLYVYSHSHSHSHGEERQGLNDLLHLLLLVFLGSYGVHVHMFICVYCMHVSKSVCMHAYIICMYVGICVLLSTIWYIASCWIFSRSCIGQLRRLIRNFLWFGRERTSNHEGIMGGYHITHHRRGSWNH